MLLLLNGAPGVGKSTLAMQWADDRPLALVVDVDALRVQLGAWRTLDETKLTARDLAVALTRAHLESGHDVVVAQQIAHTPFVELLRSVADGVGTDFVEVVLTLDTDEAERRFRARRAELRRAGTLHPEFDLPDEDVGPTIRRVQRQLIGDAATRGAHVVDADNFRWPLD